MEHASKWRVQLPTQFCVNHHKKETSTARDKPRSSAVPSIHLLRRNACSINSSALNARDSNQIRLTNDSSIRSQPACKPQKAPESFSSHRPGALPILGADPAGQAWAFSGLLPESRFDSQCQNRRRPFPVKLPELLENKSGDPSSLQERDRDSKLR
jgi:hypothetical protein